MKKSNLLFLFIIIASLVSCDKTSELNDTVDGYLTLQTEFVYPYNARNNYSIVCNGDTLTGNSYLVSRTNPSVTLEVFEKGKKDPDLSQELTLTETKTLQFIKLQGQPLVIYEADKYTTIKINIVYAEGENAGLYKVLFNGVEVSVNRDIKHYVLTDQLTGTLEIQKEGQVVYSQEETFQPEGMLSYMQLSEAEYLKVTDEELPDDPAAKQTYVRFFFFPSDVNGVNQLELTTYYLLADRVSVEKVETLILNPGVISKYFLYDFASLGSDGQRKRGLVHDLRNLETGEVIIDHTANPYNNVGRGTEFKFATAQIKDNGRLITVPIGERW